MVKTQHSSSVAPGGARAVLDASLTERQWQRLVLDYAALRGWLCYHPHDSRRSERGFPDLTLVHPEWKRIVFLELKRERGRVRPEQEAWIAALNSVDGEIIARVARPSDWEWVQGILGAW